MFFKLSSEPASRKFGFDLGKPIDRVFIEDFLQRNSADIKGCTGEIGYNEYTQKFGKSVERSIIIDSKKTEVSELILDLSNESTVPPALLDCLIITQTLNFIYDFHAAIRGIHKILKPGAVCLCTVAAITQVSQYDDQRWGDFWRFNPRGISRAFEDVFGAPGVKMKVYGNLLSAISLLDGRPSEKLSREELFREDPDYPIIITLAARKNV
jgi:hypothetical protein